MRKVIKIESKRHHIVIEQYGVMENFDKIILFCHGFPGTNRLVNLEEALKNKPVSIVEINYRGDKKSGGKFSFLGSMADILTVARYLKRSYGSIPIYAIGYSMGGFYVANLLNLYPSIFDGVILLNPVVDTEAFFSDKALMDDLWKYARDILSLRSQAFYEKEIIRINQRNNPMKFAHRIKTPIIIVQSGDDEVLDPEIVKKFFVALELNCVEKRLFWIPNAKHDLMGDEEQLLRAIIE